MHALFFKTLYFYFFIFSSFLACINDKNLNSLCNFSLSLSFSIFLSCSPFSSLLNYVSLSLLITLLSISIYLSFFFFSLYFFSLFSLSPSFRIYPFLSLSIYVYIYLSVSLFSQVIMNTFKCCAIYEHNCLCFFRMDTLVEEQPLHNCINLQRRENANFP